MVAPGTLALLCAILGADDAVLLDFTASWCGPCRMVAPTVERLAAAGYPVRKVDIDREPQLAERFQVRGVPCFVMLVNGQEVDRVVGPASYDRLRQMIDRGRASSAPPRDAATAAPPAASGGVGFSRGSALAAWGAASGAPAPPAAAPETTAPAARPRPAHLTGGAFEAPAARSPSHPFAGRTASATLAAPAMQPLAPPPAAPLLETTARDAHAPAALPPMDLAMAATVKLEVEDARGMSFGTGTIVDRRGDDALIVTCGHIFRDSAGQGAIKVFAQALGGRTPLPGRAVHYDLERDIALVTFRPTGPVGVVPVVAAGYAPAADTPMFSIGCNKGGAPTIMQGRVLSLGKRCIRPAGESLLPLLEVSGRPIDGRSGGGLFTLDGRLAGVCNFADQEDDRGLYACPTTIQTELDRNNLSYVYQRRPAPAAQAALPPSPAGTGGPAARLADVPPPSFAAATPFEAAAAPPLHAAANAAPGQVVCIVPSASGSGATQTLVIDRPSAELLQLLAREAQPAGNLANLPLPRGTVVRGQNAP